VKRSKRPARGNGNRDPSKTAGHQHPLFNPFGTHYWRGRECRVRKFHLQRGLVRSGDGLRTKGPQPARFTIDLLDGKRDRVVPCSEVWKQPHPKRTKVPFTKRRRLGT
jgi:hypothetical protein